MPEGSNLRISSSVVVHGRTEEKTCCSRIRRAMSWVYWPPKSRTTTPPSSEFGRCSFCCICAPLDIVLLRSKLKNEELGATGYAPIALNLNPQVQTADLSYRSRLLRQDQIHRLRLVHLADRDYATTRFTSLSGTTICFTTRLPFMCWATAGSASAFGTKSASPSPAATFSLARTRPFTCTTTS